MPNGEFSRNCYRNRFKNFSRKFPPGKPLEGMPARILPEFVIVTSAWHSFVDFWKVPARVHIGMLADIRHKFFSVIFIGFLQRIPLKIPIGITTENACLDSSRTSLRFHQKIVPKIPLGMALGMHPKIPRDLFRIITRYSSKNSSQYSYWKFFLPFSYTKFY